MLKLARHTTLRQLQIFEAIARLRNVTRAGEELHLTQPTVSTQLKHLADAVGAPLLEYVGRQLYLTAAGEELYSACREIFERLDRVEMKVADLKGLKQGYLRLAVITTAKYFAPEVLGRFCKKYPDVDVSIAVTNRDTVLERMANNMDDLYILGHNPARELDMETDAFAPNPLFVMAERHHPLVGKRNISLHRIAEEPFIMRESGSGIRDAVERLFASHGLTPTVRLELGSNEAIKHALIGQLGISVLSLHSIMLEGSRGPLTLLDVEGFPLRRQWNVAYPRGKVLSVIAHAFLTFLHEEGQRLGKHLEQIEQSMCGTARKTRSTAPRRR